ncbi:MAG TPA: nucleotide exchange factor GrpE [Gemmatimonadaceae bacterium]|nr:nucleotide exchange factor GrpE [Gemmatimonadaceae bacterium]
MTESQIPEPVSTPDQAAPAGEREVQNAAGDTATLASHEELHRAMEEQRDKYLRLAAEYDNFRKRAARERQEAGWRAQGDLVAGLIDVIDDVMRFAHVDPDKTDARTVVDGVAMVEKKLFKSLAGHGLEVVNPQDHRFDPALHEAITTVPAGAPDEDELVAQVYQLGFVFRGQLLRPARVVVKQWNG